MMIFMLILKIIGIVLCVIIGILAMILFVPVCYKVDADIDEGLYCPCPLVRLADPV